MLVCCGCGVLGKFGRDLFSTALCPSSTLRKFGGIAGTIGFWEGRELDWEFSSEIIITSGRCRRPNVEFLCSHIGNIIGTEKPFVVQMISQFKVQILYLETGSTGNYLLIQVLFSSIR